MLVYFLLINLSLSQVDGISIANAVANDCSCQRMQLPTDPSADADASASAKMMPISANAEDAKILSMLMT